MESSKKSAISILIPALALLKMAYGSTLSYYASSPAFSDLPGFYNNSQQLVDFLFFSLLFISVYLIGVRYAFREMGKPEKAIAVLLGVLTSFLLVLNGYSISMLVDYVNWVFVFLLFAVIYLMLKGIKSRFWRFALALLITIAVIMVVFGYLDNIDVESTV